MERAIILAQAKRIKQKKSIICHNIEDQNGNIYTIDYTSRFNIIHDTYEKA